MMKTDKIKETKDAFGDLSTSMGIKGRVSRGVVGHEAGEVDRVNSLMHLMRQAAFQLYISSSEDRLDDDVIKAV